jgi:hypothetical protein
MNNGRRNQNYLFLELDRLKIKEELIKLKKVGFKEENLDMGLKKINKQDQEGQVLNLKIIKLKPFKKDLKQNLFKKPLKVNQVDHQRVVSKVGRKVDLKADLRLDLKEVVKVDSKALKERKDDFFNLFIKFQY